MQRGAVLCSTYLVQHRLGIVSWIWPTNCGEKSRMFWQCLSVSRDSSWFSGSRWSDLYPEKERDRAACDTGGHRWCSVSVQPQHGPHHHVCLLPLSLAWTLHSSPGPDGEVTAGLPALLHSLLAAPESLQCPGLGGQQVTSSTVPRVALQTTLCRSGRAHSKKLKEKSEKDEKMIVMKCQRLRPDKTFEEIEIELPLDIFNRVVQTNSKHNKLDDHNRTITQKIKNMFLK